MRLILFVLLVLLTSSILRSQDINGQWNGELKVQGTQLRLVFNIAKTESGISSTMDSPDQGAKGIPTTTTSFENSILKITISSATIEYEGKLGSDNIIVGNFKQGGQSFPMNLSRQAIKKEIMVRPQEPRKPYPYYTEDVLFENKKAGIQLAGTLSLPQKDGSYPVVILISGSGPQNRDEELMGHKPFLVLADHLTKNGIGVLRYDDRGTAASKGDFKSAKSADFAQDVESAITYLKTRKEVDKMKIGLVGHSEGGLIAPMVASKSQDVSLIVLLAGPGLTGSEILLLQQKLIGRASGMSEVDLQKNEIANKVAFDIVNNTTSLEQLKMELTKHLKEVLKSNANVVKPAGMSEEDFIKSQVEQVASPWMQYFIKYNPVPALEKVKCPVLALNGAKDLQVPPKENMDAIRKALAKAKNKKVVTKELPNLNHLFQECKTGSPDEYSSIEQTFSPTALSEILSWIQAQVK
jgi:uncharacterized protein